MSRLFKRKVEVIVWRESTPSDPTNYKPQTLGSGEQLEIRDLRVKFRVVRDFSKHPNSAEVEIYNLAPHSRALLQELPLKIQVSAGYDDGPMRLVASGDVRFTMSKQDGVDWVTMIQIGDGARAYAHARVNKSFGKNTTYRQLLGSIATSMGLKLPSNIATLPLDTKIVTGATLHGPARDEMTRVLDAFGLAWSIQNGTLRILSDQAVVPGSALPLGVEQGMIGTPEFGSPPKSGKKPHMTVKCLLYPELIPGDKIQLTSKAKSGLFKLVKVEHAGDTAGGEFMTSVEIQPL